MSRPIILVVRGPTFFSPLDEEMLFRWFASIPCFANVRGVSSDLHITLKRRPGDMDLRELTALLYRYRMDMTGLAAFKSSRNKKWFAENKYAYWHTKVFGRPARKRPRLKPTRPARPSA